MIVCSYGIRDKQGDTVKFVASVRAPTPEGWKTARLAAVQEYFAQKRFKDLVAPDRISAMNQLDREQHQFAFVSEVKFLWQRSPPLLDEHFEPTAEALSGCKPACQLSSLRSLPQTWNISPNKFSFQQVQPLGTEEKIQGESVSTRTNDVASRCNRPNPLHCENDAAFAAAEKGKNAPSTRNARAQLNELSQARSVELSFSISNEGSGHQPKFVATVLWGGHEVARGEGSSKSEAKEIASDEALVYLKA